MFLVLGVRGFGIVMNLEFHRDVQGFTVSVPSGCLFGIRMDSQTGFHRGSCGEGGGCRGTKYNETFFGFVNVLWSISL